MATVKKFNLKSFIIATLRRGTYRFRPRSETMTDARVERGKYRCSLCKKVVGRKSIKLDHILPVIDPAEGFVSWDKYIERMYPDKSGWQAICCDCHDVKTKQENELRKSVRATKPKKEKKK